MQWRVDYSAYQTLLVCACGCRIAAGTRATAYRLGAEHDRRAHPGTARHAIDRARRLPGGSR